jgi:hypothetical protein
MRRSPAPLPFIFNPMTLFLRRVIVFIVPPLTRDCIDCPPLASLQQVRALGGYPGNDVFLGHN